MVVGLVQIPYAVVIQCLGGRGHLGRSVNVIVVLEFCKGKEIVPIILSLVDKKPKVLL